MSARDQATSLEPFRCAGELSVTAEVARDAARLALSFELVAPPGALRVAPPAELPGRRDGLWRHTCCEAFLAPAAGVAYWEVNVAPSGDWNVYAFSGYRSGMTIEARVAALECTRSPRSDGGLALHASFDVAAIAELARGPLDVGLAAVLEHDDGTLAYFALRHPGERPDFHHRDAFALRLA